MISVNNELLDKWPVIIGVTVCVMLTTGIFNAPFPFLYDQVIDEYGWSREQATLLASWRFIAAAIIALTIGEVVDRIGSRTTLIIMTILGGAAMSGFLLVDSLSSYYLCGMILGGAAVGVLVPIKVWMSQRFDSAQGTAVGITQNGTTLIQFIAPFVIVIAFAAFGWRMGMAILSGATWLIALPLIIIIFYESHQSAKIDSRSTDTARDSILDSVKKKMIEPTSSMREICREKTFWMLATGLFLGAVVMMGMLQNAVLFLKVDKGLDASIVAGAVSLYALCSSVGKIFFGWIYDKLSTKGVMISYFVGSIGALIGLSVAGVISAYVFSLIRGLAAGGLTMNVVILSKHCFGTKNLGRFIGVFSAILYLGFALGPWLMAYLYEQSGSYDSAFWLFGLFSFIAMLLLIPVRAEYWEENIKNRT